MKNGVVQFIGEMTGIVDAKTAVAGICVGVCFIGMNAGLKILSNSRLRIDRQKMHTFIERDVAREIAKYGIRH